MVKQVKENGAKVVFLVLLSSSSLWNANNNLHPSSLLIPSATAFTAPWTLHPMKVTSITCPAFSAVQRANCPTDNSAAAVAVPLAQQQQQQQHRHRPRRYRNNDKLYMSPGNDDNDSSNNGNPDELDSKADDDGMNLASDFFRIAQERNIGLDEDDLLGDDDEEEEDDDDDVKSLSSKEEEEDEDDEEEEEEEINIPQGAINAFLGWDSGEVGDKLAGNVSLTDDQLYSEVKERVLDTAGGFVKFVRGADDDEEDEETDKPKEYKPPDTVPDSGLTAGEVVTTVLDALLHNDVPTENRGVEILFGYSSAASQIKNEPGLTPEEYAEFLKEQPDYKVLFDHGEVIIDKGDYSFDKKKAFFTARLRVGDGPLDFVPVNFILSTTGHDEDDCWLIDSMLIRPKGMRRMRRR